MRKPIKKLEINGRTFEYYTYGTVLAYMLYWCVDSESDIRSVKAHINLLTVVMMLVHYVILNRIALKGKTNLPKESDKVPEDGDQKA
jgi:hypothetical protein